MSIFSTPEYLDKILNIVDYYKIQKLGGKFVMRCPFHFEKTPSMSIDRKKGTYHCFGCSKSGEIKDIKINEKSNDD